MKKLKYIIIAIILCIPTLVAVKSYMDAREATPTTKTATRIQIDDLNGDSFVLEKSTDGSRAEELVDFFLSMNSGATKVVALPDAVAGQKCYCVTISSPVKDDSYQYYMSTNPSLCYLVKPDGSTYQLNADDAGKFLSTEYAECLYPGAVHPTVKVSGEFSPAPSSASWKFKNYSGVFTEAETSRFVSKDTETFTVSGIISVEFDKTPDICNVKITDANGNEKFNDSAEELSNVRFDENAVVNVSVRAEWYEDPSREYCGVMEYSFNATVKAPAAFNTAVTSTSTGRFFSIVASNVDDPSKIEFSSEPSLSTSPVFYKDGISAYGFLAIPFGSEVGKYTFTFKYGATVKTIEMDVSAYEYTTHAYMSTTPEIAASALSDAATEEFNALVKTVAAEASSTMLYNGAFGTGVPENCYLTRGFGRPTSVNGDPDTEHFYKAVYYNTYSSVDVTAANTGKVVYVGSTAFSGNTVVIEHGYGLKTWYWGLGSTKVNVGDRIEKGAVLGTSGKTGLAEESVGVNVAMSVGETFVCPYDSWASEDGGVLMYGVLENKPGA